MYRQLRYYHGLRAKQQCYRCHVKCVGYACEPCRVVLRAVERARRARLKAQGICRYCSGQTRPGFADCQECAEAVAKQKQEYRLKRLYGVAA